MFDKNLFLELCEKYNVELSNSAKEPMIKDGENEHAITNEDVSRIISTCQTFFGYSGEKFGAKVIKREYYFQEDFAIAC